MLYQLEETYLKKKALRATRQQKAKEKKALKKTSPRSPAAPPQGDPNAVSRPSAQSSNKWEPSTTPQTLIFCQEVGHSTRPLLHPDGNKWAFVGEPSFRSVFSQTIPHSFYDSRNPLPHTSPFLGIYIGLTWIKCHLFSSRCITERGLFHLCNHSYRIWMNLMNTLMGYFTTNSIGKSKKLLYILSKENEACY